METRSGPVPGISIREDDRAGVILRASAIGMLSLGLGLGAHVLSGGVLPSPAVLAVLAALSMLGATLVARTRPPGWVVLVALGVAQQVLHWLLTGLGGGSTTSGGGSLHHDEGVPVGEAPASGHSPEVMVMLHLHLAVALAVGWLVVRYPQLMRRLRRRGSGTAEGARD